MKTKIYGTLLAAVLFLGFAILNLEYKKNLTNPEYIEAHFIYRHLFQINNEIYDTFFRNKTSNVSHSKVVLIAVDENSVREFGRWPWNRDILATIIENGMKHGLKSIGNDIIYSEEENNKADSHLEQVLKKYTDQVVLGTFGEQKIDFKNFPYQDYCFNEAFLHTGGESIVKLNASVVIDDEKTQFEELNFKTPLKKIFEHEDSLLTKNFLDKSKKPSAGDLNQYQRNNLDSLLVSNSFGYCRRWLTIEDEYLNNSKDLAAFYDDILGALPQYKNLALADKITRFKNDVNEFLVPQYTNWVSNIRKIQEAAYYTGSFIADMDFDGVNRHYPLLYRTGNKLGTSYIPALALQTYLAATGYQAHFKFKLTDRQKTVDQVIIKDPAYDEKIVMSLPVDLNGRLIVNYYGAQNTLPYVSARDLFHDEESDMTVFTNQGEITVKKSEFLKDKVAILGATATAIYDLRNTPVATALPGPEIHLSILSNLFDQEFMKTVANETSLATVTLLALVIAFAGAFLYGNLIYATALLLSTNYILYLTALHSFQKNVYFDLLASLVVFTLICYILFLMYVYFFEIRKSKEIKKTFSKYVSKEIVEQILKNQDNLQLKGQKLNMTVFFSDIRSFTTLSEEMDPQELSLMLNKYFTPMSEAIFGTDGTVDKFMGDAIMALFGAPLNYPDHPQKACHAALECFKKLVTLNEDFKVKNWPEIKIGIGINTGIMVAGNIGSDQIQSYTVIGDEVNLAQRLESLTKTYKIKILISESTYLAVKNQFVCREIDIVRVKGKNKAVRIYELIEESQNLPLPVFLTEYSLALKLFQDRNFLHAKEQFQKIVSQFPEDYISQIYLERSEYCLTNPVPENWDGVFDRRKS